MPQNRLQIPQMEIAPPTMPLDRALDGWNSMSGPNSPSSGLDSILPPTSGVGERSTNLRVSALSHPSSHPLQMPFNISNEISPDPIMRFYNDPGPWAPRGIADIPTQPVALPRHSRPFNLQTRYNEPNMSFSQYQTTAGSELESNTTGAYPSDSGYGTRSQATTSILSSDPVDLNQDCSSISGHIGNLQLYPGSASHGYSHPDSQASAQQIEYQPDTEQCQSASLRCLECGVIVKCQSEMKYAQVCRSFLGLTLTRW